mgnify:FL=1
MRRKVFIAFFALLLPAFCNVYAFTDVEVVKTKFEGDQQKKDIFNGRDGVALFHEDGSRTISIAFNHQSDDVRVKIFKEGKLVVDDKETADRSTVIGYTFAGTDAAQCTVVVETEGVPRLADTVDIE